MAIKDIAYVEVYVGPGKASWSLVTKTIQLEGSKPIDIARQLLNMEDLVYVASVEHDSITLEEVQEAMFNERKVQKWMRNNTRVSRD